LSWRRTLCQTQDLGDRCLRSSVRYPALQGACRGSRAGCVRLAGDTPATTAVNYIYFGERESACVLTSRLCLSTTRRNSRSIVLKASWITLLRGSCVPLSFCFSSATSSWPRATVTSIRHRYGFPL